MTFPLRTSFATRDPEEALPVLEQFYPDLTMAASVGDEFRFDLDTVDTGLLSTMRYRLTSPNASSMSDTSNVLTVTHLLGGHLRLVDGKDELDATKPFLAPPRRFKGIWDDVHVGGVSLDLAEIGRFAQLLARSDSFGLVFTDVHPATAALSRFWTASIRMLNRDLLRDDEAMASPLIRRAAFEQLALAPLTVFPSTFMELREPTDGSRATSRAVRRAMAFIDENLSAPIMIPQIAAAAGLSVRGLTAAFRRELDTTPSGYLRLGRLSAAHRDLRAAQPGSGTTVGNSASRPRRPCADRARTSPFRQSMHAFGTVMSRVAIKPPSSSYEDHHSARRSGSLLSRSRH